MKKLKRSFQGIALSGVFLASVASAANRTTATLEKVIDGDTVSALDSAGKRIKIRYAGIDAPEAHFLGKSQAPWGDNATKHLLKLFNAKEAKIDSAGRVKSPCVDATTGKAIEVELELEGKDRYKRDLGYVHIGGVNTNLKMMADGQGFPYLYCTTGSCDKDWFKASKVADFVDACKRARKDKLGVFDPANALTETPSQFRRRLDKHPPYQYIGDFDSKKLYKPADDKLVDPCVAIRFQQEEDALALGYNY